MAHAGDDVEAVAETPIVVGDGRGRGVGQGVGRRRTLVCDAHELQGPALRIAQQRHLQVHPDGAPIDPGLAWRQDPGLALAGQGRLHLGQCGGEVLWGRDVGQVQADRRVRATVGGSPSSVAKRGVSSRM